MTPYVAPQLGLGAFNCPHCDAYANQSWYGTVAGYKYGLPGWGTREGPISYLGDELDISECTHCKEKALWLNGRMIYPLLLTAPKPNPETPEDVAKDFEEARQVVNASPAAAAALLRRAVEKLVDDLDATGDSLNQRIGDLVAHGLPPEIQQALDYVRVTGNDHVHPGMLVEDEPGATALQLFTIVNAIVERMVVFPKKMKALYDDLPDSKRAQIDRRDGRAAGPESQQ